MPSQRWIWSRQPGEKGQAKRGQGFSKRQTATSGRSEGQPEVGGTKMTIRTLITVRTSEKSAESLTRAERGRRVCEQPQESRQKSIKSTWSRLLSHVTRRQIRKRRCRRCLDGQGKPLLGRLSQYRHKPDSRERLSLARFVKCRYRKGLGHTPLVPHASNTLACTLLNNTFDGFFCDDYYAHSPTRENEC